jgi:hypothetical protein
MECDYEIKVGEPQDGEMMYHPYVRFRLVQLNLTPQCMNDREIDEQVNYLIREAKKIGQKAKRALKKSMAKHDALLEARRNKRKD